MIGRRTRSCPQSSDPTRYRAPSPSRMWLVAGDAAARAPADTRALRHLPRRVLLRGQRQAPRVGLRRPSAADRGAGLAHRAHAGDVGVRVARADAADAGVHARGHRGSRRRLGGGGPSAVAWPGWRSRCRPYYLFAFHYLSMNAPEVLWWSLAAILLFDATGGLQARPGSVAGSARARHGRGRGCVRRGDGRGGVDQGVGPRVGRRARAGWRSRRRERLLGPWPWVAVALASRCSHRIWWQAAHGWPTAEFVRNAQQYKITAAVAGRVPARTGDAARTARRDRRAARARSAWWRASQRGAPSRWRSCSRWRCSCCNARSRTTRCRRIRCCWRLAASSLERWAPWQRPVGAARADRGMLFGHPARPRHPAGTASSDGCRPTGAPRHHRQSGERHEKGALPQHFADMFGWETLADEVARVVARCRRPSARQRGSTRRTTARRERSSTTARHAACRR